MGDGSGGIPTGSVTPGSVGFTEDIPLPPTTQKSHPKAEAPLPPPTPPPSPEELRKLAASGKLNLDVLGLDAKGDLKAQNLAPAQKTILESLKKFLESEALKKLKPGSEEYQKAVLKFLESSTKFPLLHSKDQKHLLLGEPLQWKPHDIAVIEKTLQTSWTPNRKIAHALKLEAEGRFSGAKALYKKLKEAQDAKKPEAEIKSLEADLRQSLGDASQLYHRASELDPKNITLHCEAAKMRLLWSLKEPDSKVAEQLKKESLTHLKAVTDLMRGEVLKARAFLEVGKLEEAQKLSNRIEKEFGKDLAETQGSILRKSDDYVLLTAQCALYRGEVADRQNKHTEAVPQYESALEGLSLLLKKDPKNKEAFELRARVNYNLQNYEACLADAGAVSSNLQEGYKQKLNSLGSRFSLERQKAKMSSNLPLEMLYLTEEIKIAKALKDETKANTLSKALESKTKAMAVGRVLSDSQKLVDEGKLTQPLLDAEFKKYVPDSLGKAQDYIAITEKDGKKTIALKPAFEKLSDKDKVAVLQGLQVVGMIGHHRKVLADTKDPSKKLYHEAKLALFEGNLPLAKLKMMDFKAEVEKAGGVEKLDGEGKEMLSEMRKGLKQFTLGAIQKIEQANEQIINQELAKIESKGLTDKNQYKAFFGTLRQIVESGKADTLDEAVAYMKAENRRIQEEFEKSPVIKKGMVAHTPNDRKKFGFVGDAEWTKRRDELGRFSQLLNQKPTDPKLFDPQSFPDLLTVRVEGGILDMMSAWGAPSPPPTRVIIGKEGGTIFGPDGRKYTFSPSDKERVIAFSGTTGSLIKHSVYPDHSLQEGRDYQAESTTGSSGAFFGHQLISHWMVTGPQAASYEHHVGKFGDWTNVGIRAAPLKVIFDLETREGLEKMKDPQARREYLLATAETLRARHGSYAAGGEILEGLFATDFRKARTEVEATQSDEIAKIKKEAEGDRSDIEKKVKKQVEEFKSKSPETFKKMFPGGGTDKEIQAKVDEVIQSKVEFGINKLAFKKIDGWADEGKLSDPTAAKAWKIYEDMKDPTDKWHNLADETWDGIVNEVIMTVVTMPIAMGAGSAVRAGLAGTEMIGSWALRRGAVGLATRLGIVLAGEAAFSLTQNLLNAALFGEEITLRSIGVGMAMGLAFRGGGKLWAEAAGGLGVGEKALAKAAQSGSKTQLYLMKLANTSGQLSTQTMVAFTFGEVEAAFFPHGDRPDQTVWERLGGHALRMVAFHYGMHALNVMTGGAAHRSDMLVETRFKAGKEGYKILYEKNYNELVGKGVPEKEAATQADKLAADQAFHYAKGLNFGPAEKGKQPSLIHEHEELVLKTFGVDPKSPAGQHLILLLSAYSRSKGEGGKALSGVELFRVAEELNGGLKVFLKKCGLPENSDLSQGLKAQLAHMALEKGVSPEKISEYAEHFSDLKDRLHVIANTVFGKEGSKTPEGQNLMAALLMRAILKSKTPSEVVDQFEGLSDQVIKVGKTLRQSADQILGGKGSETPEGRELINLLLIRSIDTTENPQELLGRLNEINSMAVDVGDALRSTATFIFGEKASASPEARRFMNEMFLEALRSSPDSKRMSEVFERLTEVVYDLSSPTPNIFDLCACERPAERWALIRWALRTDQTPASLKNISEQILKGQMELVLEKGVLQLKEVAPEKQVAQEKLMRDRVPMVELGPDEFHSFEEMKQSFETLRASPLRTEKTLETMRKKVAEIEQAFGDEPKYEKEIEVMRRGIRLREDLHDWLKRQAEEGTQEAEAEPIPLLRPKPKKVATDEAPPQEKAAFDAASAGRPPPLPLTYHGEKVPKGAAVLEGAGRPLVLPFDRTFFQVQQVVVGPGESIGLRFYGDTAAKEGAGHFTLHVAPISEGKVKVHRADGKVETVPGARTAKPIEIFNGDVIEVGGRRLVFHSPSEVKTRNELAKVWKGIQSEKARIEKVEKDPKADPRQTADQKAEISKREEDYQKKISGKIPQLISEAALEVLSSDGKLGPKERAALRDRIVKDLETLGIKLGPENAKIVDGMIEVCLVAKRVGVVEGAQGIPTQTLLQLLGELHQKLTPPMASEARMKAMVAEIEKVSDPAQKRKIFLKGILQRETNVPKKADGVARFVDFNTLKAESDRVATADGVLKEPWAQEALGEIQRDVLLADTNFFRREKWLRVDDHHGPYGQAKNSTEQLLDRFEAALRKVGGEAALEKPTPEQVRAAIEELNIREISTDNLADGGFCIFISENQAKVLSDPNLRVFIRQATHFEDFNAFGNNYERSDSAVEFQGALFKKYGDNLRAKGIFGSDRFPPEKAAQVVPEAMADLAALFADPSLVSKTAQGFWKEVDAVRTLAPGAIVVHKTADGKRVLAIYDLAKPIPLAEDGTPLTEGKKPMIGKDGNPVTKKITDFSIFSQWLGIPELDRATSRDEKLPLQVTVTPMPSVKGPVGETSRTLPIVAIPDGLQLPSGKGLLTVVEAVKKAEADKVEQLKRDGKLPPDFKPNIWFGKDQVILPNPSNGGTVLTPTEIAEVLLRPEFALFEPAKPQADSLGKSGEDLRPTMPPGPGEVTGVTKVDVNRLQWTPEQRAQHKKAEREKLEGEVSQAFAHIGIKIQPSQREILILAIEGSKISMKDIEGVLNHKVPQELIPLLETRLGIPSSEWLNALVKDPPGFVRNFSLMSTSVKNTSGIVERMARLVQRGRLTDKESPAEYNKETPDHDKIYTTEFERICGVYAFDIAHFKTALTGSKGSATEENNLPAVKSMIRVLEEANQKGLIEGQDKQNRVAQLLTRYYIEGPSVESAEARARIALGLVSAKEDLSAKTVRYDLSAKTVVVPNIKVYEEAAKFATSDSPMAETARLFLDGKISYEQYQKAKSGDEVVDLASRRKSVKPPAIPLEEETRKAAEDHQGKSRPPSAEGKVEGEGPPEGPTTGGPHLPPGLGAPLAIGIGLLTLLSPDLAHAATSHGPHGVDILLHGGLFTAGLIGVAGVFSRLWGRLTGGSSPEVAAPADKGGGARVLLSPPPPPPPTFIPPSVTLEMFTSREGTKSYKLQPYTDQAQTMIGFHVTARSQGIQIISETGKVTVHFKNREGRVFRAEMSLGQAQGLGLVDKTELGYRPTSKELTFNLKELAATKPVPPNFDLEEATQVLPIVGKQAKGPEAIPAPPFETGEIPTSRRFLTDNWERPILFGDVDLDNPPFMKSKATEERGSTAGVSTQGRGADLKGLKMNEDVIMRVVTPKGEEYLLDLDGMGGEGNGYLAARLGAQAFMAEIRHSGDPDKAWQMANAAIRRFNGKLRELVGVPVEEPEDGLSHQQRYLIKMASPVQVAEAEKAAQAFILNPELEMNGSMASGAGAVAVGLRLVPPRTPGAPHIIQFTWVGDARGMLLERESDGKWKRVYQTVDEGFNRHMKPGKDFDWGGGRRTYFAQVHPRANVVFNGLGGKDQVELQKTENGEVPDPNPKSLSGFKSAPHLENGIAIKEGQLAILGSDGFWEQFGSIEIILSVIEHCKTSEEAVKALSEEGHYRMGILEKAHKGELTEVMPNRFRFDRPDGMFYMAKVGEKIVQDEKSHDVKVPILEVRRATTLYIDDESGKVYEKPDDQEGVDHYKIDNFSLIAYHHQLKPAVPARTTLRRSPPPPPSRRGLPAEPIQKAADDSRSVSRPPTLTPPKGIPAATMPLLGKNKTYQLHNEPVPLSRIPIPKGEVEIYVGDPKKREGNDVLSHPVITVHDELVETGKPELYAVMEKTDDGRWRVLPRMDFKIVGKNGKVRQEAGDHKPLVLEDQDRFSIGIADFIYDAKTGRLMPSVTGDVEIQLDIPQ